MLYHFDEIIDRRETGSLKWHYTDNTIPLWVADMDFRAALPILSAIEKVTQHGVLGYTKPTEALFDAIIACPEALLREGLNRVYVAFSEE